MTRVRKAYNTQEVSTTLGTSDFILGGSVPGNRTFGAAVSDGDVFSYNAKHETLDEWETGEGSYNQAANSIVRSGPIRAGSNGLSQVAFSAGNKVITLVDDNYVSLLTRVGTVNITNPGLIPNVDSDIAFAAGGLVEATNSSQATIIGYDSIADNSPRSITIGNNVYASGSEEALAIGNSASVGAFGSAVPTRSAAVGPDARTYLSGMLSFNGGGREGTFDLIKLTTETVDAVPKLMAIDDGGIADTNFPAPILDNQGKTIGFELHIAARNETDNDALFSRLTLLGHWDGVNFVQIGSTTSVSDIKGTNMTAANVSASIANDRLEVLVTGIAAKTIRWVGTAQAVTIWHLGT